MSRSVRELDDRANGGPERLGQTFVDLRVVRARETQMIDVLKDEIGKLRVKFCSIDLPDDSKMDEIVDAFSSEVTTELMENGQTLNSEAISYILMSFARFYPNLSFESLPRYFRALIGEMENDSQHLIVNHIDNYFVNKKAKKGRRQLLDDMVASVLGSFISDDELKALRDDLFRHHH
ncbi:MAG: hypothetical protein Q8P68_05870 [Candidatus Peregrinibacteria bacterium]|nr:hypothetical protein [Candidatus Peregrinibacteria bacterium]MDZ4244964.1 hypothetical protein [Candidatus Gracilibacteria bacterium]